MGNAELTDTMTKDGIWDTLNGYRLGATAENITKQFQITLNEQDSFSATSQKKQKSP